MQATFSPKAKKSIVKNWANEYKQKVREILFSAIHDQLHNVMMLPSNKQLDVREGLKRRKITKDTAGFFIEREAEIAEMLKIFCNNWNFPRIKVFQNDLSGEYAQSFPDQPSVFDFAYLDICGEFTHNYEQFLRNNQRHFNNTRFAQTYYLGPRSHYQDLKDPFAHERIDLLIQILNHSVALSEQQKYITLSKTLIHLTMDALGFARGTRRIDYACIYDDGKSVMLFFMLNFKKTECKKYADTNRTTSSILKEIKDLEIRRKNEPNPQKRAHMTMRINKIRSWL